ncbi:MAG: protein kinase [Phycisphaerales bacterium]|nr:protein kinase [Phycisphaerales bacterium]
MSSSTTGNPNTPSNGVPFNRRIGPYLLLHIIGEGGFGIVWKAERVEPYRQDVAIKMIKPGMGSEEVLARFEHERQALALMRHPAVAAVLDGGVAPPELGERPYFVMEYVPGTPITDYCDQHRLSIRARLELFAHVCEGVQHAHSKGIIHRDLTPRNILVVEHDNKPQPKIIDFGISKALGRPLTDKIIFTHDGRMMGVPEYISPEQAQGLDVDTRADVYSLGVLLYELLTGTPPFDRHALLSRGWEAMLKFIREAERPHPSTRLSNLGHSADEVAHRRGVEPRTLTGELSRGLGWIPLKALEPERSRRYQTPTDLAADIRRYLNDDYDPPFGGRALDRARRFTRRNRRTLVVAGAIIAALSAWLAGTRYQLGQTRAARQDAVKEAAAARQAESRAEQEAYDAHIAAAGAFLAAGDAQAARNRLSRCRPDARAWEWNMLQRRAGAHVPAQDFSEPLVWAGFDRRDGRAVALTSAARIRLDGSSLARGPADADNLRFGDAQPGTIPTDQRERAVSGMSRGDRALLLRTVGERRIGLMVLNLADGSRTPIDLDPGLSLADRPDPCASADADVVVAPVWQTQAQPALLVTDSKPPRLIPLDKLPNRVALSADGRHIAAAWSRVDSPTAVRVWADDSPALLFKFQTDAIGTLKFLHISATSVAAAGDRAVAVWSLMPGAPSNPRLAPGNADIVAFDDRHDWLAIGDGRDLRLHNIRTGGQARFLGQRDQITSLAFSPGADRVLAGSRDSSFVRLWNIAAEQCQLGPSTLSGAWSDSAGSTLLFLGTGRDARLSVFDPTTQQVSPMSVGDASDVHGCALCDDGSRLALLRSGRIELWQLSPPSLVCSWPSPDAPAIDARQAPATPAQRLVFAPGSTTSLFVAGLPASVPSGLETRIFHLHLDAAGPASTVVATLSQKFASVPTIMSAPSPHGVLAASLDRMFVWTAGSGAAPRSVAGEAGPAAMAVSPDGRTAAVLAPPGHVYLVPTTADKFTERQTGHQPRGRAIAWIDDTRFATGASDGGLIIWAVNPLRALCVLRIDTAIVAITCHRATGTLWVIDESGRAHAFAGAKLP